MTTRYFIIYCTKGGVYKIRQNRTMKSVAEAWKEVINKNPIWAIMHSYDSEEKSGIVETVFGNP